MRHGVVSRKFDRSGAHRQMMFRNLVTELLDHETIKTTEPKAKVIRSLAEKMITLAKKDELNHRRQALSFITEKRVVDKLFKDMGPRYADRQGGYTRIIKLGPRTGDGAPMVQLELV